MLAFKSVERLQLSRLYSKCSCSGSRILFFQLALLSGSYGLFIMFLCGRLLGLVLTRRRNTPLSVISVLRKAILSRRASDLGGVDLRVFIILPPPSES